MVSEDLSGDWPHLTLEEALHRDPDVILFAHSESFTPAPVEFQSLPGWRDFRAVKSGRMFVISDAVVRACPRLVDALEQVARALHPDKQGAERRVAP